MTKNIEGYIPKLIVDDMIKSAIESNNLDLRVYLENLNTLKPLVQKVERGETLTGNELQKFESQMQNIFQMIQQRT